MVAHEALAPEETGLIRKKIRLDDSRWCKQWPWTGQITNFCPQMRIAYWYFHLIYLPWIKESIISLLTFSLTRLSTQRIPSFWLEFSIILYIICQTLILVGAVYKLDTICGIPSRLPMKKRRYKPSLRTEENLSGQKIIQGINTDYLFNPLPCQNEEIRFSCQNYLHFWEFVKKKKNRNSNMSQARQLSLSKKNSPSKYYFFHPGSGFRKEEIWPFLRRFSVISKVLVIGDFQGYH